MSARAAVPFRRALPGRHLATVKTHIVSALSLPLSQDCFAPSLFANPECPLLVFFCCVLFVGLTLEGGVIMGISFGNL
jgi:hypothetical protein